jgi:hypothetical protein
MEEMFNNFNSLMQNPFVTMISLILALIGVLLAIIFYIKGKRKKSLQYCFKNDLLIENFNQRIEGLNIKYLDKSISKLMVTKIAFWNNGTETINVEDIPCNDKLSIVIDKDYEILNVSMICILNETNNINFDLLEDGKKIIIDFEYIDKNDGFVMQIFHTANDYKNFDICGTIKGFGKISKGKSLKNIKFGLFDIIQDLIVFIVSTFFSLNLIFTIDDISIKIVTVIILISFIVVFLWKIFSYYSKVPIRLYKYLKSF